MPNHRHRCVCVISKGGLISKYVHKPLCMWVWYSLLWFIFNVFQFSVQFACNWNNLSLFWTSDYGFERHSNGQCLPAFWYNPSSLSKDCSLGQSYLNSTGWVVRASRSSLGGYNHLHEWLLKWFPCYLSEQWVFLFCFMSYSIEKHKVLRFVGPYEYIHMNTSIRSPQNVVTFIMLTWI